MHVLAMLFRNLVAGNLLASWDRCWFSRAQSGMLEEEEVEKDITV